MEVKKPAGSYLIEGFAGSAESYLFLRVRAHTEGFDRKGCEYIKHCYEKKGMSYSQIARHLSISKQTVMNWIKRINAEGRVNIAVRRKGAANGGK